MNRKPQGSASRQQRAREQQAVLNQLRAGQGISGARPANPLIGPLQNLTGVGAGAVPTLYGAALGGQEVLLGKGGWNKTTAATGPINVGGQTWYPAQSGQDLVYKRAPGNVGGQYGSIFSADQLASPAPEPGSQPPAPNLSSAQPPVKLSPEEQAYNAERSRIAQLTAQNPEFQNVGQLRNDLRDQGMAIWAAKHGGLAKNVKPGQSGYEAIQQQLGAGAMGAPQDMGAFSGVSGQELLFNPSSPLASAPASGPTDYTQVAPNSFVPGMPGIGGNYFGGAANQAQASLFSRFQQNAPGGTPLPTGMNPGLAPGSPYAQLAAGGIPAYGGNTDLQGVGPSLTDEGKTAFASDKARAQAEEFKKRVLSSGK